MVLGWLFSEFLNSDSSIRCGELAVAPFWQHFKQNFTLISNLNAVFNARQVKKSDFFINSWFVTLCSWNNYTLNDPSKTILRNHWGHLRIIPWKFLTLKGWILIFALFYFSTQFAFNCKYEQIKLKLTIKFYQYLKISF